jgi:hypothetical protein
MKDIKDTCINGIYTIKYLSGVVNDTEFMINVTNSGGYRRFELVLEGKVVTDIKTVPEHMEWIRWYLDNPKIKE